MATNTKSENTSISHDSRHDLAFNVIGGPTTVIDIGGWRLLVDPTFDEPGEHGYLTKTAGPAIPASPLGPLDAVLLSHDQHADNLDTEGRRVALAAPLVLTHPGAARRLGSPGHELRRWQSYELSQPGRVPLTVQAVPAVHGPADGVRDTSNNVNCEVTGFVLSAPAAPTIYVSGDNASIGVVAEIARRCPAIDIAVLFIGAARVPHKEGGRPLTLTSARAAAAAEIIAAEVVIPAHLNGWAHFSEGIDDVARAFEEAGISDVLAVASPGEWIVPERLVSFPMKPSRTTS
jgi:L-ascorbate metabolism protein UlaG (beta-lactamase superfamily)